MSFHRTILVTCSALFVAALTSATYAQCGGCGGWGFSAPVAYAPLYSGGCGGCGAVAVQPVVEVQPIAVQPVVEVQLVPIAAAPIAVGCGGCGGCGGCSSTFAYQPVVASPYYVVNQGPAYTGPGVMVPFGTYAPGAGLSNPAAYPYIGGPGYGYGPRYGYGPSYGYGPRYGYGARYGYGNPYRRPYGWRG
jgi:hypothetical protein